MTKKTKKTKKAMKKKVLKNKPSKIAKKSKVRKVIQRHTKKIIKKGKALPKRIKKKRQPKIEENIHQTKIKVIGIGGGGGSIVSEIASGIKKIDFIAANTDLQALRKTSKECKVFQFGKALTYGLGCGMDPEIGRKAAELEKDKIKKILEDTDFCIFVSCLGGGTGSGASPIFAEIAKELNTISFGIFTLPFEFEGEKKARIANQTLEKLKPNLNALTIISNEKIFQIIDKDTSLEKALSSLNKILEQGVEGLMEMLYLPGLINIDWADLKAIFEGRGKICYLNSIERRKEKGPEEITRELLHSPLNEYNIQGTEKILYNIASDKDLKMEEVEQISRNITNFNTKAKIIFGVSHHSKYKGKIRLTLLSTGCSVTPKPKPKKIKKEAKKEKPIEQVPQKPTPQSPTPSTTEKVKNKPSHIKLKKQEVRLPKKIKSPVLIPKDVTKRKNALEIKKEAEQAEKEILEQEKKWEIPAFLRKKDI